jgi:carboxylesterase type B
VLTNPQIYGGGYTEGEKGGAGLYNPAGLIKASKAEGGDGIVYVAMNYRLGAFGWLAGPSLQADGVANAGLYDQRLALDWVQQNIHLFGGDKTKVTIMGESAGGGSIMHQITAFGGLNGPAPFARAIPQSPGFRAIPSSFEQEETLQAFLGLLNVSTIEEARQLPSAALIQANAGQVASSTYGTFTYGPVMDGLFAPALPGKLLSQGSFHKDVKVLVGHNSDEGLLFTNPAFANPAFTNDTLFGQFIQQMFPSILVTIFNYITTTLYPQVFDGSYPYKTQFERALLATAEAFFTCNTYYLDRAFGNATYACTLPG